MFFKNNEKSLKGSHFNVYQIIWTPLSFNEVWCLLGKIPEVGKIIYKNVSDHARP